MVEQKLELLKKKKKKSLHFALITAAVFVAIAAGRVHEPTLSKV